MITTETFTQHIYDKFDNNLEILLLSVIESNSLGEAGSHILKFFWMYSDDIFVDPNSV